MEEQNTALCAIRGGTIDDLIVFRQSKDKYLLGVNVQQGQRFEWIKSNVKVMLKYSTYPMTLHKLPSRS